MTTTWHKANRRGVGNYKREAMVRFGQRGRAAHARKTCFLTRRVDGRWFWGLTAYSMDTGLTPMPIEYDHAEAFDSLALAQASADRAAFNGFVWRDGAWAVIGPIQSALPTVPKAMLATKRVTFELRPGDGTAIPITSGDARRLRCILPTGAWFEIAIEPRDRQPGLSIHGEYEFTIGLDSANHVRLLPRSVFEPEE